MPLRSVRPLITPPEETIVTPSAVIVVADVVPPDATSCWNLTIVPTARPPRETICLPMIRGGRCRQLCRWQCRRQERSDRQPSPRCRSHGRRPKRFPRRDRNRRYRPGLRWQCRRCREFAIRRRPGNRWPCRPCRWSRCRRSKNRGAGNATRNVYSAAGFDQRSDRSPRQSLERSIEHGRLQRCAARQHKLFANGLEDRSQREAAARNGLRGNSEHGIVGFAAGKDRLRGFED